MRLRSPRIPALADHELSPEQTEALAQLGGGPVLNIYRTLVRAPKAFTRFIGWGGYMLSRRSDLTPRDRELAILRTGFRCRSGYEWAQHEPLGRDAGLSGDEIARVKQTGTDGWSAKDAAIVRAADELHDDQFIGDATWQALAAHFTRKQIMDLVFTIAQYTQVSMILNSFGVQLDPGQALDPDLAAYAEQRG